MCATAKKETTRAESREKEATERKTEVKQEKSTERLKSTRAKRRKNGRELGTERARSERERKWKRHETENNGFSLRCFCLVLSGIFFFLFISSLPLFPFFPLRWLCCASSNIFFFSFHDCRVFKAAVAVVAVVVIIFFSDFLLSFNSLMHCERRMLSLLHFSSLFTLLAFLFSPLKMCFICAASHCCNSVILVSDRSFGRDDSDDDVDDGIQWIERETNPKNKMCTR